MKNNENLEIKFKSKVLKFIKENKLSKSKFCKLCNISKYSLEKILKGSTKIDLNVLVKVCNVLKLELKEIFI